MGRQRRGDAHDENEDGQGELPIDPPVEPAEKWAQQVAHLDGHGEVGAGVDGDAVDEAQVHLDGAEDVGDDSLAVNKKKYFQ